MVRASPGRGCSTASTSPCAGEIIGIAGLPERPGVAIVVVSSELPEILAVSDRVLVMREG